MSLIGIGLARGESSGPRPLGGMNPPIASVTMSYRRWCAPNPTVSIGRDLAVDEPLVEALTRLPTHAEPLRCARAEVRHQHVRPRRTSSWAMAWPSSVSSTDADRALVAVRLKVVAATALVPWDDLVEPPFVARRSLELDDVGAE